jgi:hypothetical protein
MSESTKPTLNEAENGNKSKPLLCDVLISLKENTIVAFKEKERSEWFTGVVNCVLPPNEKRTEYYITINLNVPIEPQWYDGEQTVYYLDDISDLVVLENIT